MDIKNGFQAHNHFLVSRIQPVQHELRTIKAQI